MDDDFICIAWEPCVVQQHFGSISSSVLSVVAAGRCGKALINTTCCAPDTRHTSGDRLVDEEEQLVHIYLKSCGDQNII